MTLLMISVLKPLMTFCSQVVVPIFALPPLSAESGMSSPALDDFIHYMIAYVYPVAVILQVLSFEGGGEGALAWA